MDRTLKILSVGLLSLGAIVGGNEAVKSQRKPIELEGMVHGGNMYSNGDRPACAFYKLDEKGRVIPGSRIVLTNEDADFNQAEAYDANGARYQGNYKVYGYVSLGGNYATNIVSKVKEE